MIVVVNGESVEIPKDATIVQLLQLLALDTKMIAVEVSGEIITKSEHANYIIQPSDKIEIIKAVGGG